MYQRILVPIDGSATSSRGLQEAIRVAQLTHGSLRLLHVIDQLAFSYSIDAGYSGDCLPVLREAGTEILAQAQATAHHAGVESDMVMHDGMQARLWEYVNKEVSAWNADLVVLGTHGRRGVGRMLLGSDAELVVRSATVPVLLVRAPEIAAPKAEVPAPASVHVRLPSSALAMERSC